MQGYPGKFWRQRDGTLIAVAAMSDRHLHFTIRMVKGSSVNGEQWRAESLPRLLQEQEYRKWLLTVTSR